MPGDLVTIVQPSTQTNNLYKEFPTAEHSACGVYMRVNVPHYDTATQQFVVPKSIPIAIRFFLS